MLQPVAVTRCLSWRHRCTLPPPLPQLRSAAWAEVADTKGGRCQGLSLAFTGTCNQKWISTFCAYSDTLQMCFCVSFVCVCVCVCVSIASMCVCVHDVNRGDESSQVKRQKSSGIHFGDIGSNRTVQYHTEQGRQQV